MRGIFDDDQLRAARNFQDGVEVSRRLRDLLWDNYDDQVDNAVTSMTSLMEPIMIVCLALIVGSIVVALFLPILNVDPSGNANGPGDT